MQGDIYKEVVRVKENQQEAALVTVIAASGSTPREEGAKMLVRADGSIFGTIGGGNIEKQVIKMAAQVIKQGKPKRLCYRLKAGHELGMICGGDVEVFIEPVFSEPTMFIFGGGHIALPLVRMAGIAGFKIVVIDDRPEFSTKERFPEAEVTITEDFSTAFSGVKVDKSSYIVIVTHGHKGDEKVLEGALATEAKYIGMIGSRAKNKAVFSHLLAKGFSQEQLDKVHAPIGLKIGGRTPEEIAVSILAEVVQIRRSGAIQ